jgi:hypothetical protein
MVIRELNLLGDAVIVDDEEGDQLKGEKHWLASTPQLMISGEQHTKRMIAKMIATTSGASMSIRSNSCLGILATKYQYVL